MKPAVAAWLEFAETDLRAAKALLKEGGLETVVCFHAQQSVEKCLKALIEFQGTNPLKSHDLIMLYGLVDKIIELEEDTLAALNQVYIDARYPASLGSLPGGPPDAKDASDFLAYACDVLARVKVAVQAGF
jgi:HEPN domain-containing protein